MIDSESIASSPMEPRSGCLARAWPGRRVRRRAPAASGCAGPPSLEDRRTAGVGSGLRQPTTAEAADLRAPSVVASDLARGEAARKGRQPDPGLPVTGWCSLVLAHTRPGSVVPRGAWFRLWQAKPCPA